MNRWLVCALVAGVGTMLDCAPASAFWQRSQWSRCSDATTESERERYRCWELNGYVDPGWPALGTAGGYVPGGPTPPAGRWHKGVTQRLG